jgi:hypothetical protein
LIAGHVLGTAAIVFVLLGLVGLYVVQAKKVGWMGLAGFLLAFVGNVLLAASGNYGYIAPVLAARAPDLLAAINAYGPEYWLNAVMVVTYLAGFVLLGIATVRAGFLPRWGGVLLIVGVPLFFAGVAAADTPNMGGAYWIAIAGQTLFGLGLVVLGWPLLSGAEVSGRRVDVLD